MAQQPDLQERYDALRAVMRQASEPDFNSGVFPTFDLDFLSADRIEAEPAATSLWTTGDNVYRLAVLLIAEVGETLIRLVEVDALLQPYHQFVPIPLALRTRATPSNEPEQQELQRLPHSDENIQFTLHLGLVNNGTGNLQVQVASIEPNMPLHKARVSLLDGEGHLLERILTGVDGVATFQNLSLGQYLIQIQAKGARWEFSFNLVPQQGPKSA